DTFSIVIVFHHHLESKMFLLKKSFLFSNMSIFSLSLVVGSQQAYADIFQKKTKYFGLKSNKFEGYLIHFNSNGGFEFNIQLCEARPNNTIIAPECRQLGKSPYYDLKDLLSQEQIEAVFDHENVYVNSVLDTAEALEEVLAKIDEKKAEEAAELEMKEKRMHMNDLRGWQ
ncbi:MAG: hypothetical protein KDD25_05470, partial [Bdellovibrionales bacterium]|nr:hypothetical protein [Bdellovibrionales bacterium]